MHTRVFRTRGKNRYQTFGEKCYFQQERIKGGLIPSMSESVFCDECRCSNRWPTLLGVVWTWWWISTIIRCWYIFFKYKRTYSFYLFIDSELCKLFKILIFLTSLSYNVHTNNSFFSFFPLQLLVKSSAGKSFLNVTKVLAHYYVIFSLFIRARYS